MQAPVGKTLVTRERFALTLERLCHPLLADWVDFSNACIGGIQPKGTLLAHRRRTLDAVVRPILGAVLGADKSTALS